jgi:sulfur carrier protein ThiS
VKVRVHYHDAAFNKKDEQVDLPESSSVQDLLDRLGVPLLKTVVIDGRVVRPDFVLVADSEIFLFSQMAGG